jgi:Fe-S-cluster-containing hydrogenase component 2
MQKAIIAPEACRSLSCPTCLARQICPTKAIVRIDRDESAAVDCGRCRGCGKCVPACPWQAIRVVDQ